MDLREKIEANRLGVVLKAKASGGTICVSNTMNNCFQSLKGSKKERCQRNLRKLSGVKEMLERCKGNHVKSMNIAFAVYYTFICSLFLSILTSA